MTITIFANLKDIGLTAHENIEMIVKPSGTGQVLDGNVFLSKPLYSFSDTSGYISQTLPSGANIFVRIPQARYERYLTIPNSGTLDLSTI